MTLKVIGSGFGRTGTLSLKMALEQLGLGPCYHMMEVFKLPDAPAKWVAAADGNPDWESIFQGFNSTVDWPNATYYRELAEAYPDAKVVHTERDADDWFDSTQATIFSAMDRVPPGPMGEMFEKVIKRLFDGDMHDRAHCTAVFRRHNQAVRDTIPADRLLVYEVAQGWGPLCAFLGVPEPATPMPSVNSREDFAKRMAGGIPS